MNPQHQRMNSSDGSYPSQMNAYYQDQQHQQQPSHQQHHSYQSQPIVQQHQQPMYPVLPSMNHPPPPLRHHHDPSFAQHQPMQQAHMHLLQSYWVRQMHEIQNVPQDFKVHHLPLARIKKVMKTDDDVKAKMISADAPMIFDKGCDIFITELTLRAWIHAEENKRRTLQRSDIAAAIAKTDMFDFLIDIVPREEYKISLPKEHKSHHSIQGISGEPDRRRSQEVFQPMPGPGSATGPKGPSGALSMDSSGIDPSVVGIGLEGYYPYAVLEGGTFALEQDPQLQMQYLSQQQGHPQPQAHRSQQLQQQQ